MPETTPSLPRPTLPQSWYARLRLLSLDVVIGALGSGWMVATWLDWHPPWAFYLVLPLAVWIIYTADHLLDAYRLRESAHTPRHLFHFQHFRALVITEIIAGTACLTLAFIYFESDAIGFGVIMGVLVALHFLLVKLVGSLASPLLIKESGVAFIYTMGIWGLPLWEAVDSSNADFQASAIYLTAFVQFFLLALINLLEFSLFEYQIDETDGHTSFVRAIGPQRTRWGLVILFGLLLGGMAAHLLVLPGEITPVYAPQLLAPLYLIYFLMALILGLMLIFFRFFEKNERYRAWGDGAFVLPFLYPLIAWLLT
ncbi:MAG: hypothetical protein AAF998_16765 [Bacteroidota bacterium]